jgi:hypothetical protein
MGVSQVPVATATSVVPKIATFTSTGTFVCPAGVTVAEVLVVGGGGGGGAFATNSGPRMQCAAGGGGGEVVIGTVPVTPGTSYTVTIGSGGAGGIAASAAGGNGGNSSFGTLVTAYGGMGASTQNADSITFENSRGVQYGGTLGASTNQSTFGNEMAAGAGGSGWRENSPAFYATTPIYYAIENYASGLQGKRSTTGSGNNIGLFPNADPGYLNKYGGGGGGGLFDTNSSRSTTFAVSGGAAGALLRSSATTTSLAGANATANTGGGGGGGVFLSTINTDRTIAGGAGGSGYVEVRYVG